ncbi:hypothetical protein GCM10023093_31800 [Nemorincola caseinilytica]|uniref:Lipoprotein n=1 Tax=Nemorincola caseinilytica TaxID=2054315 RepID=A0ABP8NP22_9BACT
MKHLKLIPFFILLALAACRRDKDDSPRQDPDNEVVTTVQLRAVNVADTTDVVTAEWRDLTPNTGDPDLTKAYLVLRRNAVYDVSATILDETHVPIKDVGYQIWQRADYHLVCYARAAGLDLTIVRTDHDNHNPKMELGLLTKWTTGAASNGNLRISVRHQAGVKNGTDCGLGSNDAEVNFSVRVE